MNLHHYTQHPVTQTETLLMQTHTLLKAAALEHAYPGSVEARAAREALLQHLNNTINLLGDSALGYEATLNEMLPLIAQLADAGRMASDVAEQLLAPAYEELGECYVNAAMAQNA